MVLKPLQRVLLAPVEMDPDEDGGGFPRGAGLGRIDLMALAILFQFKRPTVHFSVQTR